ncbi:MAG: glycosyltransferase [Candidatus Omnitrophica bacterium]|nr:glycosyltransferase [Candidatus Omnitrophota bacterium]
MKTISVVIVTYNNINMLEELLSDLYRQTRRPEKIIIVDNASKDATQKVVRAKYPELSYIRLSENTGSAGGYFLGLKEAVYGSCNYVLTLDDDVRLSENTIEELQKGLEFLNQKVKISAVRSVGQESLLPPTEVDVISWRNTLFDVKAIKQVGFPRKELFIYGDDLEYSLRFSKNGYSFYWINSSKCSNPRLGGQKRTYLFGRKLNYYTEPFRLYYAFRNELFIFIEYRCFIKAIKLFFYALRVIIAIILFERPHIFPKIGAILFGLYHGLIKKLGKCKRYTFD